MPHVCVLGAFVSIAFVMLIICIRVRSSDLRHVPRRHREHAFSSGVHHKDTLTWAVKLNLSFIGDEDIGDAVGAVAADTGLFNQGQIGSLDGYYVFSHPSGVSTEPVSFSSLLFHSALRTVSQDEHRRIKDRVHEILDRHPFVEWYMLQRVVPRFRRTPKSAPKHRKLLSVPSSPSHSAAHFNDPLYHKQWHLVGISFREFVLLQYFWCRSF